MANEIKVNDGGTWRNVQPYVNHNGVWKLISTVEVNDNGSWRQVFGNPDTSLYAASVASSAISGSAFFNTFFDVNGAAWSIAWFSSTNQTLITVNQNVFESYWYSAVWDSRGLILMPGRTTFTPWNGSSTSWLFAGDGLALDANAGAAAVTLTIEPY